jgi:hypothetical protein
VFSKLKISSAVKQLFCMGYMLEGSNDTSIILVPKVDNPLDIKDFRPISLCKIVSKCLVDGFMTLLCEVISEIKVPLFLDILLPIMLFFPSSVRVIWNMVLL